MRERILAELQRVEREQGVRVLFGCESGSRAWGFASPDSDWDVRFIYAHDLNWYLSVETHRDVIERMLPDDLDLAGWDIRKALGLLRKSNPSLLEWLNSPIIYRADESFLKEIRALAQSTWSASRLLHHYLSMARSNSRTYLQGEQVSRKKYLYALRPLLAAQWIERGSGLPPIEFDRLRAASDLDVATQGALDRLLEQKKVGNELAAGPPIPELSAFIDSELERLDGLRSVEAGAPNLELFDIFFRKWIGRKNAL